MQHLVAAAVAALVPDRVAIVDDRGNLLAGGDDKTGADATAANQEQSTTDYEDRLRQRVESIVASVVGAGHVRVQVAADMNYNHTSTTSESYDPDSKVIRSTQTVEQNATDTSGSPQAAVSVANALPKPPIPRPAIQQIRFGPHRRNHQLRNLQKGHDLDQDGGDMKHLSVAVVVDGTVTGAGAQRALQAPHRRRDGPDHQPGEIGDGLRPDPRRPGAGHQHGIRPRRHRRRRRHRPVQAVAGLDAAYWFKIIEASIMCLTALLIGLFVARPLIGRMFAPNPPSQPAQLTGSAPVAGALPAPGQAAGAALQDAGPAPLRILPAQPGIDLSQIEGQVRESSAKKIGEVVNAHPEEALAIIRTWLHQPV